MTRAVMPPSPRGRCSTDAMIPAALFPPGNALSDPLSAGCSQDVPMSGNSKGPRPVLAGQRSSSEVSGGGLAYQGHTPSTSGSRPSRNTHNLGWTEDVDGVPDRQGGCGPVAVGGSFEVVVAHLAAYDTGVGAEPAFGQQRVQKLGDGAVQCGGFCV